VETLNRVRGRTKIEAFQELEGRQMIMVIAPR